MGETRKPIYGSQAAKFDAFTDQICLRVKLGTKARGPLFVNVIPVGRSSASSAFEALARPVDREFSNNLKLWVGHVVIARSVRWPRPSGVAGTLNLAIRFEGLNPILSSG